MTVIASELCELQPVTWERPFAVEHFYSSFPYWGHWGGVNTQIRTGAGSSSSRIPLSTDQPNLLKLFSWHCSVHSLILGDYLSHYRGGRQAENGLAGDHNYHSAGPGPYITTCSECKGYLAVCSFLSFAILFVVQ